MHEQQRRRHDQGAVSGWTRRTTSGRSALAAAVLLAAAGCSGNGSDGDRSASGSATGSTPVLSAPAESPTPSPSISVPAGLSAKESEAVDKAIEAYRRYIVATDLAAQSGGTDLAPLEAIAAQVALITARNGAMSLADRGWHGEGSTQIARIGLEAVDLSTDPATYTVPEVILTSCLDTSGIVVLDESGASVVTGGQKFFDERTWVRYYPQSEYPQVGPGVDGWVVGQHNNKGVDKC